MYGGFSRCSIRKPPQKRGFSLPGCVAKKAFFGAVACLDCGGSMVSTLVTTYLTKASQKTKRELLTIGSAFCLRREPFCLRGFLEREHCQRMDPGGIVMWWKVISGVMKHWLIGRVFVFVFRIESRPMVTIGTQISMLVQKKRGRCCSTRQLQRKKGVRAGVRNAP